MGPKPDPEEFKNKHYAHFEELMMEKPKSYLAEHIPGAVLFNIDAAYYPSKYIRFDLYPPEDFEKFIRLLGVNNSNHVPGNFIAKPIDPSLIITFEELDQKNADGIRSKIWTGRSLMEHQCTAMMGVFGSKKLAQSNFQINYLDARPAAQYNGSEPLGIPAKACHWCSPQRIQERAISTSCFGKWIETEERDNTSSQNAGFNKTLPTVTACLSGVQASMLAFVLSHVGVKARVYN
ncbi:hypothetical protein OSTOST_22598, partial [Ostertagia ostertagi]